MSKRVKQLSYWSRLNSLWESSGVAQKKFCSEQGVDYNQFVYWRSQVLKKDNQLAVKPKLMTVVTPYKAPQSNSSLSSAQQPSVLEVILPSGIKLHIKTPSDIDKASSLLEQL